MSEYMDKNFFEQDIKGFLFFSEPTFAGTERSKIIFEFNKEALYKLREGDIVAVESFTTLTQKEGGISYALLEILRLSPTHITIDRLKKYKFMGAVREFLKESTKDFEEDDPRIIRDHVYIEADAGTTGYMMKIMKDTKGKLTADFVQEPCKPILGRDVGVLTAVVLKELINKGVKDGITVGELYSNSPDKRIPVLVNPHKMITHHYSIFGFTGSGKSNLNSVIITRLLEKEDLKVVVFDLSDEYTALMIDKILSTGIVLVDESDMPESVSEFLQAKTPTKAQLEKAAKDLAETSKKPGIYDSAAFVPSYERCFNQVLKDGRIKILSTTGIEEVAGILTLMDFLNELDSRATSSWDKRYVSNMRDLLPRFCKEKGIELGDLAEGEITDVEEFEKFIGELCDRAKVSGGFRATVEAVLAKMEERRKLAEKTKEAKGEVANVVDPTWVIKTFVEETKGPYNLCILVSSVKENLITVLNTVLEKSLEIRRRVTRKHSVLFVVDEGHEFLINPREAGTGEERVSSKIIERLTRLGRKYGLGVCVASQRVAYLNTTAISNCHTTFIGSLPRKYDRDTMNEAYAVSQDILNQVVTFPPGNWYVLSMIATGMKNVPVRIVAPNREIELAKFFDGNRYLGVSEITPLKQIGYL